MKLKITSLLTAFFLLLGSGAVKDYVEPEERAVVTALSIENKEEIYLTAEVNMPDKKGESRVTVYTSYGQNIEEAIKNLEKSTYGKLFLSQCPVILLEKGIEKTLLKNIFYQLFKNSEISLSVRFVVFEKNSNILSENSETVTGYEIENLLNNLERHQNKSLNESFAQIIDKSRKSDGEFSLPVIAKENQRITVAGSCRFINFSIHRKEDEV